MRLRVAGVALALILVFVAGAVLASTRSELLKLSWRGKFPASGSSADPPKPLLVYILCDHDTQDQVRFDNNVLKNESFLLAAKFFDCVQTSEEEAKKNDLLKDLKWKAPVMIAFDSTRKKSGIAGGRAAGMKVYALLVKIGQPDYKTSISKTVRSARNLLGSFDRVDAAREALGIKLRRLSEAKGDGNAAKTRQLQREVAKDQAAIEALLGKTNKQWDKIWTIERKKPKKAKPKKK